MVTPVTTSQLRPAIIIRARICESTTVSYHRKKIALRPTCSTLEIGFSRISDTSPCEIPPCVVSFSGGKITTVSARKMTYSTGYNQICRISIIELDESLVYLECLSKSDTSCRHTSYLLASCCYRVFRKSTFEACLG